MEELCGELKNRELLGLDMMCVNILRDIAGLRDNANVNWNMGNNGNPSGNNVLEIVFELTS